MTRIASHRGGTLEYGDSTWAGFSATASMSVDEVEFDIHPTADGRIIVHHDAILDDTTDTRGAIVEMSAEAVRRAIVNNAGAGFRHPLFLEDLCAIFEKSPVGFRCEIKPGRDGRPYADFVPRAIAVLDNAGLLEKTGFSSFFIDTLVELSEATTRPMLWLVSPPVLQQVGRRGVIELACTRGLTEIGVHIDTADSDLMDEVTAAGLAFGCWAAHSKEQIEKAFDLGVKVFTTDRPSLAMAIRDARTGTGPVAETEIAP